MFTVRVDRGRESHTAVCCARYTVTATEGGAARLVLQDVAGRALETVLVGGGDIAYVMNESGVTVDVVRPPGGLRAG